MAYRNKTGFVRKKKSNARKLRQHHSRFRSETGVDEEDEMIEVLTLAEWDRGHPSLETATAISLEISS